jgi:uncharacterized protein with PIN domain
MRCVQVRLELDAQRRKSMTQALVPNGISCIINADPSQSYCYSCQSWVEPMSRSATITPEIPGTKPKLIDCCPTCQKVLWERLAKR